MIDRQALLQKIDTLFEELTQHQQTKALNTARVHHPHLTGDDILNPHDYPKLMADPIFNYEEGVGAGILASHLAVRRLLIQDTEL